MGREMENSADRWLADGVSGGALVGVIAQLEAEGPGACGAHGATELPSSVIRETGACDRVDLGVELPTAHVQRDDLSFGDWRRGSDDGIPG